jgi:hypothetical protein
MMAVEVLRLVAPIAPVLFSIVGRCGLRNDLRAGFPRSLAMRLNVVHVDPVNRFGRVFVATDDEIRGQPGGVGFIASSSLRSAGMVPLLIQPIKLTVVVGGAISTLWRTRLRACDPARFGVESNRSFRPGSDG